MTARTGMKKEANQMCIIVTLLAVPMVSAREEPLAKLKLYCGRPVPVPVPVHFIGIFF